MKDNIIRGKFRTYDLVKEQSDADLAESLDVIESALMDLSDCLINIASVMNEQSVQMHNQSKALALMSKNLIDIVDGGFDV